MHTFFDLVKLIEYVASAVIVILSNLCLCPSPRTKTFSFILSVCVDELFSTPKMLTFLTLSRHGIKKCDYKSNWIPNLE